MAEEKKQVSGPASPSQGGQVSINLDQTPILYTDNVMLTSNDDGIVFDFCQRLGSSPQVRVVARIGMSREHAKKLLMVLTNQVEQRSGKRQTGMVH